MRPRRGLSSVLLAVGALLVSGCALPAVARPGSEADRPAVVRAAPAVPDPPVPEPSGQAGRFGGMTDGVAGPEPQRVPLGVVDLAPDGSEERYGVGIPVEVTFTEDIPDRLKPVVQAAATVETSRAVGPALWTWLDDDTMAFRPREFWPGKTTVVVRVRLAGLEVGALDAEHLLVGVENRSVRFRIGREQITKVNLAKQMGIAYRDGEPKRTFLVSTGKPGWRTRQGVKVIHERVYNKVFTNDAVGDFTEDYRLVSRYALRLTASGEFLHSAPWALGRLGVYAGSHGCTNVSDTDAAWFFEHALYGDPVVFVGDDTAPEMEDDNGLGGPWNVPWAQWKEHSAAPPLA